MTLTVVIPCYNEASRGSGDKSFQSRLSMLYGQLMALDYQVLLVDDGSTDDSLEVFNTFVEGNDLANSWRAIHYEPNKGKGEAVRRGLAEVGTDYALMLDADMSVAPYTVVKLMNSTSSNLCYIGTRFAPTSKIVNKRSFIRRFISYCCRVLMSILFGLGVSDTQCGFKLIPTKYCKNMTSFVKDTWLYDVEILYNLKARGVVIKELPVRWENLERESTVKAIDSIVPCTKAAFLLFSKKREIRMNASNN